MKKVISSLCIALALLGLPAVSAFAVQSTPDVGSLSTATPTQFEPLHSQETNLNNLGDLFKLLRNFLFTIIGLVIGALILYAGFLYMTSAGEPDQIKKSQSIILYVFIGIAVIALSVIIVRLVAGVLGIDVSFLF